jgi:hypothetical protein
MGDPTAAGSYAEVSWTVIRKLLKKHHFRRCQALKKQTMQNVPHRNEQF